jgi:hypothetical protein
MPKKWNNKLYVKATLPTGQILISPIVNITPTFNSPHVYEHDLNRDNVNVSRGNFNYTFNLTVRMLRDIVSLENPVNALTVIQQQDLEFEILIGEQIFNENGSKQFSFDSVAMKGCYVNSMVQTLSTGASPTATFACVAGSVNLDGVSYNGSPATIP